MVTAKFHTVGDSSSWYRVRIQDEIASHGLDGNVIDAGESKLAVVVDGKTPAINKFYKSLKDSSPQGVTFTALIFGDFMEKKTPQKITLEDLFELLKEIESNTRRINQKLAVIMGRENTAGERHEYGGEPDADDEDAASSFAAMFGGE